jgi:uncharacterized phage protein gp47/JayE
MSLTDFGLIVPTQQEIFTSMQKKAEAIFGNDLLTTHDSSMGQFLNIFAERMASVYEAVQELDDSNDPDNAQGKALEDICSYSSVFRLQPQPSSMYVACTGKVETLINGGMQSQVKVTSNNSVFYNVNSFVLSNENCNSILAKINPNIVAGNYTLVVNGITAIFNAVTTNTTTDIINGLASSLALKSQFYSIKLMDGTTDQYKIINNNPLENTKIYIDSNQTIISVTSIAQFQCVQTGAVDAPMGNLQIIAGISGWDSARNVSVTSLGRDLESEAELRIRRSASLALTGQGTLVALYARLKQVSGVSSLNIYENKSMNPDANGLPPKSFLVVVAGGSDRDIASTIWGSKPAGIETFGGTSGTTVKIYDSQNFPHDISFTRPTTLSINVVVNLKLDPDYWINPPLQTQIDAIKSGIVQYIYNYCLTLKTGQDVIAQKMFGIIYQNIPGILNLDIQLGSDKSGLVKVSIYQIAYVSQQNIMVNQV